VVRERMPSRSQQQEQAGRGAEVRSIAARYADAWESSDVEHFADAMNGHKRVRLTGTIGVPLPPTEAFALFTPTGERAWAEGWDPRFPLGRRGRDRAWHGLPDRPRRPPDDLDGRAP
jgi:hypothetical protein